MTPVALRPERASRFAAPDLTPSTITRSRVLSHLLTALQKRLVVVVAPPGYGKTILLAQAARAIRRERVRWISIEARHNDVGELTSELADALGPDIDVSARRRHPRVAEPSVLALQQFDAFLHELTGVPPTVLVLDDLHHLTDASAIEVVALLADHAPRTVHIALATRVGPPLPLYRLHLTDMLAELRQRDLAFSVSEAEELLRRVSGRRVDRAQAELLVDRTEGWAAGLHLAAMSLRERDDVDAFIEAFAGDDRLVADYLTDAVLERIPAEERSFLLSTCPLDELTPDLCDAVMLTRDGHRMLEQLTDRSMFVSRVPQSVDGYRYHGLFRAYLRQSLREESPVREIEVLRAAATWHEARGDLPAAVRYLGSIGAWRDIVECASGLGQTMMTNGRAREVADWLELIPEGVRRRQDDIAVLEAAAVVVARRAHGVVGALDALGEGGRARGCAPVATVLRALHSLNIDDPALAASLCRSLDEAAVTADTSTLPRIDGLTSRPEDLRCAVRTIEGTALAHLGEDAAARLALDVGLTAAYPLWRLEAHASMALLELWSGRLRSAERHARRALALGDELSASSAPGIATATIALAGVLRDRDDLQRAVPLLDGLGGRRETTHRTVLLTCLHAIENARIALACGKVSEVRLLASSYRLPVTGSFPDHLRSRWRAAEARLLLASGDVRGAVVSLELAPVPTAEVASVQVELAVARGDLAAARALLDGWPDGPEPITSLELRLWRAVIAHFDGHTRASLDLLNSVATEAETEGNLGLFSAHPQVGVVRALYRVQPSPFLRMVIEQRPDPARRRSAQELVEQLTERECTVLALLPHRLTNVGIAESMGVSLNTVKTHLRHVYQKLQVENRSDAIAVAERLHLL